VEVTYRHGQNSLGFHLETHSGTKNENEDTTRRGGFPNVWYLDMQSLIASSLLLVPRLSVLARKIPGRYIASPRQGGRDRVGTASGGSADQDYQNEGTRFSITSN
jgi:hypothetical protein